MKWRYEYAMTFVIVAAILTLLTIAITLLPVFGSAKKLVAPLEYDKEIYKARLGEIEEEHALGKMTREEYQYTISEEGRRFLKLAAGQSDDTSNSEDATSRTPAIIGASISAILIPVIAFVLYFILGSFNAPDRPLQARLDADPQGQSVQELLARAENQLQKNPDEGRGWLAIAPVYMRIGRLEDAVVAYRNAMRIMGPSPELQTALGEALSVAKDGTVSPEALELFTKASIGNPDSIKPKFFLAIALNQSGDFKQAAAAWRSLIENTPADVPWLAVARQQLQLAQSNLTSTSLAARTPDAPGNPTREDVEDAASLSTSERQDFINSMVERLSEQLSENPQNKAGWQRIIRSLTVLGRKDEALEAIGKAQQAFKDDTGFLAELARNKQTLTE